MHGPEECWMSLLLCSLLHSSCRHSKHALIHIHLIGFFSVLHYRWCRLSLKSRSDCACHTVLLVYCEQCC